MRVSALLLIALGTALTACGSPAPKHKHTTPLSAEQHERDAEEHERAAELDEQGIEPTKERTIRAASIRGRNRSTAAESAPKS